MDFSTKQYQEMRKYIDVIEFIHLISYSTKPNIKIDRIAAYLINEDFDKQVTSYFSHKGKSYSKDLHKDNFGFDLNTREFLTKCDSIKYAVSKYFLFRELEELEADFYYLLEDLESIECIKNLEIDFDRLTIQKAEDAAVDWNEQIEKPIHKVLSGVFDSPETRYLVLGKLFKLDSFSILQAACLISGSKEEEIEKYQDHLEFTEVFYEYISYKLMLELAVKNDELSLDDNNFIASIDLKEYLFKAGYIIKGFNDWLAIEPAKPLIDNKPSEQLENSGNELKEAQEKIAELENQLAQAKAELAYKPADNVIQSNTDIQNLKKAAIKQFNRSLATVLIDLDYQTKLRKGDIVNFIMPYMKELAFVLADEDKKKADNLTVSYNTLYDNHLQGLEFKQGRQSDDDKKKVNIDLLFKKQLPVTE